MWAKSSFLYKRAIENYLRYRILFEINLPYYISVEFRWVYKVFIQIIGASKAGVTTPMQFTLIFLGKSP